jgi:hypothetical protein
MQCTVDSPGSVLPSGPPGPRPTRERSATVQRHGPSRDNTVSARLARVLPNKPLMDQGRRWRRHTHAQNLSPAVQPRPFDRNHDTARGPTGRARSRPGRTGLTPVTSMRCHRPSQLFLYLGGVGRGAGRKDGAGPQSPGATKAAAAEQAWLRRQLQADRAAAAVL